MRRHPKMPAHFVLLMLSACVACWVQPVWAVTFAGSNTGQSTLDVDHGGDYVYIPGSFPSLEKVVTGTVTTWTSFPFAAQTGEGLGNLTNQNLGSKMCAARNTTTAEAGSIYVYTDVSAAINANIPPAFSKDFYPDCYLRLNFTPGELGKIDLSTGTKIIGYTLGGYSLGTANDSPIRTPDSWIISGSNDGGATWTVLDTQTHASTTYTALTGVQNLVDFDLGATTGYYSQFRMDVSATQGNSDSAFQIGELAFWAAETKTVSRILPSHAFKDSTAGQVATTGAGLTVDGTATAYLKVGAGNFNLHTGFGTANNGEGLHKLFDGTATRDPGTKMCATGVNLSKTADANSNIFSVVVEFDAAQFADGYSLGTPQELERSPTSWNIYGLAVDDTSIYDLNAAMNDLALWTLLGTVDSFAFNGGTLLNNFDLNNDGDAYNYYRFDFLSIVSNLAGTEGAFELSELALWQGIPHENAQTPEPATWVMMLLGTAGLAVYARRKRK